MTETLGAARVLLTVDTADFEARVARAKNLSASFGTEAEAAYTKADTKAKRAATTLLRYAETLAKTSEEQRLYNAAASGVPVAIIEAATARINQFRLSTEQAAQAARELAATQAFEKQAAEAAKLVQASNYVRFWEDALQDVEAQETKMAANAAFLRSLEQKALAIDKTTAELLEMKAAEMGVSAQAAPFIARLKEQEGALRSSGIAFNQYGLSVKQTQAALRQVPAQLTDIIVSLQGGQAPLTVLLQQGGQLRDVFGGIRPAFAAISRAALGLINPMTVAAAAVIGLGAAFLSGSKEADEFGKAIAVSGNRAGQTLDSLSDMARELDNIAGVTQGSAAAVLAEVVRSGRIAANQVELVGRAAIALQQASGKAIGDTISDFVELGKSPTEAVLRLNESMNFLTDSLLEQIRTLEQQGRVQDAAALAQQAFADAAIEAATGVRENLGYLETAWKAVSERAAEAWDEMKGVGREETVNEELERLVARVEGARATIAQIVAESRPGSARRNAATLLEEGIADDEARIQELRDRLAAEGDAAEEMRQRQSLERQLLGLQTASDRYRSDAERRAQERMTIETNMNNAIDAARALNDAELERRARERGEAALAGFDAREAERASRGGGRGVDNARMRAQLDAIKAALEGERALIEASRDTLEAEYGAKLIPAVEYYDQLRELVERDNAVQVKALEDQLAVLRDRNASGRDELTVQGEIAKVEGDLARVRAEGAAALRVLRIEEDATARARAQALASYQEALDANNEALARRVNAEIAAIGVGTERAQRERELSEIYREQAEELRELARALAESGDQQAYDDRVEALRRSTQERVRITQDGFAQMDAARGNWLNGLTAGIENWMAQASNVAAQVERITVASFDRISDAIADAALTGKFAWREMLADILSQIVRFLAQQALLNFLKVAAGSTGGGGTGVWGTIISAFTANAKGNVYDSPSLSKYSNQVHDSPKVFAFAKGAGVFAEAGPEAIMPLKRGADGTLGVRASMGASGDISVSTNVYITNDGTRTETQADGNAEVARLGQQISSMIKQQLTTEMRPGGLLYRVGVQQR